MSAFYLCLYLGTRGRRGGGVPCVFLPFHTPLCPWAEEREKERRKKRVERHVKSVQRTDRDAERDGGADGE